MPEQSSIDLIEGGDVYNSAAKDYKGMNESNDNIDFS